MKRILDIILRGKDNASGVLHSAMNSIGKGARGAGKVIAALGSSLGEIGGKAGKVTSAIGNMVQGFLTMGPIGALMAGLTLSIDLFTRKAKAAAEEALQFANTLKEKVAKRLSEVKAAAIEALTAATAAATAQADAAARSYNRLAAAVKSVAAALAGVERAENNAAIAALQREKERAVAAANPEDADAVAADYDIKIAQAQREAAAETAAAKMESAQKAEKDAVARLKIAEDRVKEASAALEKAKQDQATYEEIGDKDIVAAAAKAVKNIEDKLASAKSEVAKAVADVIVAQANTKETEFANAESLTNAEAAVERAERNKNKIILDAEKKQVEELDKLSQKVNADQLQLEKQMVSKRIDAIREANAKELAEIDKRIAAEREKERKWEEEAKGMREAAAGGGKGLGDFFRNRRDQRDERREARNRAVALARVNREIADLERRGGPDGRRLSDAQRERLKELRDFVNRQDPKNNPAAKAAAALEKLKLDAIKKTNTEIDTLRKSIEQRTVL
jgi:hypothetical protein